MEASGPRALTAIIPLIIILALAGCATSEPSRTDAAVGATAGPEDTIIYRVPVESSEPGARIEVNGATVGTTPMVLKINGDEDGTFHNFGSLDFIVRAYPPGGQRPPVTKAFKTGGLMSKEDRIPDRIYFDFETPPPTQPQRNDK